MLFSALVMLPVSSKPRRHHAAQTGILSLHSVQVSPAGSTECCTHVRSATNEQCMQEHEKS